MPKANSSIWFPNFRLCRKTAKHSHQNSHLPLLKHTLLHLGIFKTISKACCQQMSNFRKYRLKLSSPLKLYVRKVASLFTVCSETQPQVWHRPSTLQTDASALLLQLRLKTLEKPQVWNSGSHLVLKAPQLRELEPRTYEKVNSIFLLNRIFSNDLQSIFDRQNYCSVSARVSLIPLWRL